MVSQVDSPVDCQVLDTPACRVVSRVLAPPPTCLAPAYHSTVQPSAPRHLARHLAQGSLLHQTVPAWGNNRPPQPPPINHPQPPINSLPLLTSLQLLLIRPLRRPTQCPLPLLKSLQTRPPFHHTVHHRLSPPLQ